MALPYQGGSYGRTADWNFVSSMDLHKDEIDPELTKRYGDQSLHGFLTMIGAEKGVASAEYSHFEEERIYPKIKATSPGGATGAAVTFTLDAAATLNIPNNASPYVGAAGANNIFPARVGDTLLIKPGSGTVNAGSYVRAIILSLDKGAGTFSAAPIDAADSIPSIASAAEIVIYGNAHGEGSNQPEARQTRVQKYSNTLQTLKETFKITAFEKGMVTWVDFKGKDGKKKPMWYLKGESDTYDNFMTAKELTLLLGQQLTNPVVADSYSATDTPLLMTEGLIPFILSQGNQSTYNGNTGWDKQKGEQIVKTLDKQKGSKVNMIAAGIDLSINVDNTLSDQSVNGAISYGSYSIDEDAKRNFEFSSYKLGGYRFDKKVFSAMNDLQTLGAEGYGFPTEGMIIPMDKKMDKGSNTMVQSLRTRFLTDENGARSNRAEPIDLFKTTGEAGWAVRYMDTCGFEGFAGNRWAYINQA
tara:strand:+ start:42 stop:1457 length:1416 start_codon:yes stop_codon:yes gene_type:complete